MGTAAKSADSRCGFCPDRQQQSEFQSTPYQHLSEFSPPAAWGRRQVLNSDLSIAASLLRHAKQGLNFPKIRLQLERSLKLRNRVAVVILEKQQHAKIGSGIDVIGAERNDGAEFRDGQIRPVLLQVFLSLPAVRLELLLAVGSRLRETRRGTKKY